MARHCSICIHPERDVIEAALMGAGSILAQIGIQYGVTVSSLGRHRDRHIPAAMVKHAEILDELRAEQLVARATEMFRAIQTQIPVAAKAGDHKAVAMLAGQGTKICQLLMKRFDQMPPERSVNIVASVEWKGIQDAILRALDPFPEAKRAVATALASRS
ncbi:MAG: hypothetical protein WCC64_09930 [Aliidongia sp.]